MAEQYWHRASALVQLSKWNRAASDYRSALGLLSVENVRDAIRCQQWLSYTSARALDMPAPTPIDAMVHFGSLQRGASVWTCRCFRNGTARPVDMRWPHIARRRTPNVSNTGTRVPYGRPKPTGAMCHNQ